MWKMWKPRLLFSSSSSFCNLHNFSKFKANLKKSLCLTAPKSVWEFALSSGIVLKKITVPGKGYLCLMGCQWALASQNHSSFLTLGKNPAQLWPTSPSAWDENDPVPSNSLSCYLCKSCPCHTGVGGFSKKRRGGTETVSYRLLQELTSMHSREGHVHLLVPFVQETVLPEYLLGCYDTHARSVVPGDEEKEEIIALIIWQ